MRIHRAKKLLKKIDKTINEIAFGPDLRMAATLKRSLNT